MYKLENNIILKKYNVSLMELLIKKIENLKSTLKRYKADHEVLQTQYQELQKNHELLKVEVEQLQNLSSKTSVNQNDQIDIKSIQTDEPKSNKELQNIPSISNTEYLTMELDTIITELDQCINSLKS